MAHRKRKIDDFDPNKSDSDDLDYGAEPEPSARSHGRSTRQKSNAPRKPTKRRRETYGDSDDDIEVDSDIDSDDEESFGHSSDDGGKVEVNPRTGRRVRATARKPVKYEETSEDEMIAGGSEDSEVGPARSRKNNRPHMSKGSLIVRLKVPVKMEGRRVTRARAGSSRPASRGGPSPAPPSAMTTRRSSRISHDDQKPLVALTDSGKHEQVVRPGTATPEPPNRRPTRGGKGLKKPPSAIMEVSQEDLEPISAAAPTAGDDAMQQDTEHQDENIVHVSPPATEAAEEAEQTKLTDVAEGEDDEEQIVQESQDDDDDAPVARGSRGLHTRRKASTPPTSQPPAQPAGRTLRSRKPAGPEPSSDFEPDAEADAEGEDEMSESDDLLKPPPAGRSSNDESIGGASSRRSGRLRGKTASQRSRSRRQKSDDEADEELDPDEVADEAADLEEDNRRNRRDRKRPSRRTEISYEPNLRNRGNKPDYRIIRPELLPQNDDDDAPFVQAATPSRNRRTGGGGAYRSLFSTFGPFGGAGGPPPVFGGPTGIGATGGVDSDSSDDDGIARGAQQGFGGRVGMTPTSAMPKPYVPQTHNADPIQGPGGGPPGLGKVKDRRALADADPLGVDPNVDFSGVGGLEDHIDHLKEMVALPLLYPEVFTRFHVTPPRGVLFHGPPGTGKTLLARALASSVSSGGKKVTFYMRKGADALSKWVGEAEKQLRLLFEEARKNQPSIIFFDEIDGLAPVRSSKQEQIHASIVATLLALMDGMDGRGQVIVIGATNRPDSVDPALRRPGRFDREFYFPLPDQKARRAIIDIHTKGWDPPLQPQFKDQLAELTRGYGGADLRALCTEAALNAVQGTYPQIYKSQQKLLIDPSKIKVLAKDFMISVKKIVPSSERAAASGAAPLRKDVEPLLRGPLKDISDMVEQALPRKRKITALEEAMFDDREDDLGFERENLQRQFESARVFRPRLLIRGSQGMGQQYLGAALLTKLEGMHVQHFDMATLMKDSTRSVEAAIVQQFEEVKRHKPSVIFIPNVDMWYRTLSDSAIRTFTGLLKSLPPTDPVLLLGILEQGCEEEDEDTKKLMKRMMRDLFGFSLKDTYDLKRPDEHARMEYFEAITDYIRRSPLEFPDERDRKKRKLEVLPIAPSSEPPKGPSKAELKAQMKKDRLTLNTLKLYIQNVMDQIKIKYKKFRLPIVDDRDIAYLYDEQNPEVLTTDLNDEQRQQHQLFRPYELDKDEKGVAGLREVASGKFYYNLETVTIEKRLSNGYYKRPKDFLADIKRLAKDAKTSGDQDRTLKANEMLANVEVDMATLEQTQPALVAECEAVYLRDLAREEEELNKAREAMRRGETVPTIVANVPPFGTSNTTTEGSGPIVLGQEIPGVRPPLYPVTPSRFPGAPLSGWSTSATNGGPHSHQTNGSMGPSGQNGDTEMHDSQHDDHEPQHHHHHHHPPPLRVQAATTTSTLPMQGQFSQKSAHTLVAQGSQLDQYHNSASTTTSGQKTSEHRSSGPYSVPTQNTNGVHPDYFSGIPDPRGGSQIPDTQPEPGYPSSQSQHSQSPKYPGARTVKPASSLPQRNSSISAILNNPSEPSSEKVQTAAPSPTHARMILDNVGLIAFQSELVHRTSGLSVEQLEQVSASMMGSIWKYRGNWNRNQVLHAAKDAFNKTIKDIEEVQYVMGPSQENV